VIKSLSVTISECWVTYPLMDTKPITSSLLYVYPVHGHCLLASCCIIYHADLFVVAATREGLRYGPENGTHSRGQSRCRTRIEPFSRLSGTRSTTVAHSTMISHSSFWTLHSHWLPMFSQFVCPNRVRSLMAAAALRPDGGSVLLVSATAVLPSNKPSKQLLWLRLSDAEMSSPTFQTLYDKQIPFTACQVTSNKLRTHSYMDRKLISVHITSTPTKLCRHHGMYTFQT